MVLLFCMMVSILLISWCFQCNSWWSAYRQMIWVYICDGLQTSTWSECISVMVSIQAAGLSVFLWWSQYKQLVWVYFSDSLCTSRWCECICMLAGCDWRLQWHHFCVWTNRMWKILLHAGYHRPSNSAWHHPKVGRCLFSYLLCLSVYVLLFCLSVYVLLFHFQSLGVVVVVFYLDYLQNGHFQKWPTEVFSHINHTMTFMVIRITAKFWSKYIAVGNNTGKQTVKSHNKCDLKR